MGLFLLRMRKNSTELALAFYLCQLFDILHVFFIRFSVPEHHTKLHSVCLLICEDQSAIRQIAPLVVRSHCCTVDCRARCNCYPQTCSLPSDVVNCLSIGDSEVFKMISFAIEKFDYSSFLFILKGASSDSYHCSSRIPFDLAKNHRSINRNWVFIFVVFHQDQSALLISDA